MIGWDGCVVGWTGLGWSDPDWLGLGWSDPDSNPCHTPTSRRICEPVYLFVCLCVCLEFSCDDLCVIFVYMHEGLALKLHDDVFVFHYLYFVPLHR